MKQLLSTEDLISEDTLVGHADLRDVLSNLERQGPAASASDRWGRLHRRIVAYQALQALIAHLSADRMELRSATLLLRPWSCITVPIL